MSASDWGQIAFLSLIWGGSFFLIELGLSGFGPMTLVFLRMALAVPLMLITLRLTGQSLPTDAHSWWQLSLLGFLNIAFPMALFFWAQTRIDSGLASILNATVPLWGVLFTHFFTTDERATLPKVIGVLIGFAGIIVMVGPDAMSGAGEDVAAQAACLVATACFAAAAVYARRLGTRISPMPAATGQIITAALMLAPLPLLFEAPFAAQPPPMMAILSVLGLALVSTSLAYIIFFRLIGRAGANNAMLIALLMPPVAIALGVLALGETLNGGQWAGIALILSGLIVIDGRIAAHLVRRVRAPA